MKTTGKVSVKEYKCPRCGKIEKHSTNHWGAFYDRCRGCSWKNPLNPIIAWECQEPVPEGYVKPKPWKLIKMSDMIRIAKSK